ncbi:hypothetical protein [Gorillibacterium timonense]|uniref:hypothetical protein n=1 Tax=Gorillibacterium timonense TaxID=1689269 RepID=UPI00071DD9C1|nr:hypothetical protein [Gorillibacterium timonense]
MVLALWRLSPVPLVLFVLFLCGSALFWLPLVSGVRINRMSRIGTLKSRLAHARESPASLMKGEPTDKLSASSRAYLDRARLAGIGVSWSYKRFQLLKVGTALFLGAMTVLLREAQNGFVLSGQALTGKALAIGIIGGSIGWWLPDLLLLVFASRARSRYLFEISKLAERLALCVSENADIRDVLLRASRPLVLLKPHILELAAMWGKNQQEAIWRFKEAVGISEVFPLVNALYALSRAETKDVVKVLQEQARSIEATLESDVARRLENAPIWISFYIMIPFSCVVLLFLYPWLITVQTQLWSNYSIP